MARDSSQEYRRVASAAAKFAQMVADFERYGTGDFTKRYPDYDIEGTGYVARKADELAAKLTTYAADVRYARIG